MSLYAAIEDVMTNRPNRNRWVGYKELRTLCEGQEDYSNRIPKKAFIKTANSIRLIEHRGIIFHKWRTIEHIEYQSLFEVKI